MSGSKRDVWELCQHDEALAQLVRDFGQEGGLIGIEVEANGQRAQWHDERYMQNLREAGL